MNLFLLILLIGNVVSEKNNDNKSRMTKKIMLKKAIKIGGLLTLCYLIRNNDFRKKINGTKIFGITFYNQDNEFFYATVKHPPNNFLFGGYEYILHGLIYAGSAYFLYADFLNMAKISVNGIKKSAYFLYDNSCNIDKFRVNGMKKMTLFFKKNLIARSLLSYAALSLFFLSQENMTLYLSANSYMVDSMIQYGQFFAVTYWLYKDEFKNNLKDMIDYYKLDKNPELNNN